MARKNIPADILTDSIKGILEFSTKTKPRKFVETIEIHFGLKNFDPTRDKRIAGSTELPHAPRKKFACLVLGNEKHLMEAKEMGIDFRSLDDLKKVNRDKKIVKKMGKSYDKILASATIIRQVPRLLGPQLNRMGKFPLAVRANETVGEKVDSFAKNVKFAIKFKAGAPMCLSAPVGHVQMTPKQVEDNVVAAINYVLTLMKKGWQNVKKIHIKSTMGPTFTIYGFVAQ
jgi:large subunit ribosomal protein L10Ae